MSVSSRSFWSPDGLGVTPPLHTPPPCRFSVAVCRFPNTGDDWYVLVGVARDMILNPKSVGGGFIYTYRLVSGGEKLEFVHKVGWSGSAGDPGGGSGSGPPRPRPGPGRAEPPALSADSALFHPRNFPDHFKGPGGLSETRRFGPGRFRTSVTVRSECGGS